MGFYSRSLKALRETIGRKLPAWRKKFGICAWGRQNCRRFRISASSCGRLEKKLRRVCFLKRHFKINSFYYIHTEIYSQFSSWEIPLKNCDSQSEQRNGFLTVHKAFRPIRRDLSKHITGSSSMRENVRSEKTFSYQKYKNTCTLSNGSRIHEIWAFGKVNWRLYYRATKQKYKS